MIARLRRRLALLICPELALPSPDRLDSAGGAGCGLPVVRAAHTLSDDLLALARLYGRHRGLSLATVSTYAGNDGKFLSGLAAGRSCTVRKAMAVLRWLDANWPADLEWPADIPRPSRKEAA